MAEITREAALGLLRKYNKEEFHLLHALTVEAVMRWYANDLGYAAEADHWAAVGLLHDVNSVCSHGYGPCSDIKPEHLMEKVLFAADELTGLIWAAALMRPSKSVSDMELKSLKKKYKDKKFAAGCSREVIAQGAEVLGWPLDELLEKTLEAMRAAEPAVAAEMENMK